MSDILNPDPGPIQKVILIGKRQSEKNIELTLIRLKKYLEQKNIQVYIEQETADLAHLTEAKILLEKQFSHYGELIIVIGGDGSLLSAARSAVRQNLPIVGINRGKLGFLADISPDNFDQLDHILAGHYQSEKRFLLQTQIIREGKTLLTQIALNDAVLLPSDNAHMIEFSIHINQEFMCSQRADGLIITTPTGSTAYALSGGGPILHPQLDAIGLVPMFPHKLTSRPIVVSSSSEINITLSSFNNAFPKLSCDGQISVGLMPGDIIQIRKFDHALTLLHPPGYQYFSTLRSKLQWENKNY